MQNTYTRGLHPKYVRISSFVFSTEDIPPSATTAYIAQISLL
jgi:hypothetical protein